MTDAPRNTTEALGVLRLEHTLFVELLAEEGPDVAREQIDELRRSNPAFASWLTVGDYLLFIRHSLETLRKAGAVKVPVGVDGLLKRRTRVSPMFVYPRNDGGDKNGYSFIGKETGSENSRSGFIRKFAREKYGVEVTRADIMVLL